MQQRLEQAQMQENILKSQLEVCKIYINFNTLEIFKEYYMVYRYVIK